MQEIENNELQLLDLSIDELLNSMYHIEYYNKFRQISPLAISYTLGYDVYKLAWICFLVSFKDIFQLFLTYSLVEDQSIKNDDEIIVFLLSSFQKSHVNIHKDIIKISKSIALANKECLKQEKIQIINTLKTALPELALVEFSRLNGYLAGKFNIDINILDNVRNIFDDKLEDWLYQISIDVYEAINKEFQLIDIIE